VPILCVHSFSASFPCLSFSTSASSLESVWFQDYLEIIELTPWLGFIDDAGVLAVIALAFVAGGFVKGLIGGGLPSVVVPIMAIVVDPAFAAALTIAPVAATNVWQAADGRLFIPVVRRFWAFLIAMSVGVVVGAQILVGLPPTTAALLIGIAVVVMSPIPLASNRFEISRSRESTLNPLIGGIAGLVGGATVIFSPVLVYFAMLRLDKDLYVATAAVGALCAMFVLYLGLTFSNTLTLDVVRFSATLLIPTMVGFLLGRALRGSISQRAFRLILSASLALLSSN